MEIRDEDFDQVLDALELFQEMLEQDEVEEALDQLYTAYVNLSKYRDYQLNPNGRPR